MRFEREVRILSALKHPNIVSIHDSGAAAGLTYFVMDYIAGEPLDAHLARRRQDVPAVLRLFVKICDAVSAAQLHGIIHRDLKPGNIRIDQRGAPHVLDFGLAKVSDRLPIAGSQAPMAGDWRMGTGNHTLTGQFIGSLPWASPEQAGGASGDVDLRTDVYSLGVILYQALTGCFPYPVSGNLRDVLDNIQHAAPIRPSALRRDLDEEVETIVLKCVQKDRERRYQSAAELARDLQRYLAGEPIDAMRHSRLYVLRKHLTRYRYTVFAILIVMLSLIVGIVSTTWRAQRAEPDARALAELEGRLQQRADRETKSDVP
jgi:serine/threonine protein kinase